MNTRPNTPAAGGDSPLSPLTEQDPGKGVTPGLSTLPPCYRCRSQPCVCKDGCTIYHADCRDILPLLEEGSVDVVYADPPYGIVNQFGSQNRLDGNRRLQFEWDTQVIVDDVRSGLTSAFRLCRPTASCFVWVGFDSAERYAEPARRAGFVVKPAAWVKACPPPACPGNWWPSAFELAYYGYRKSPWFCDENTKRRNVWVADSYRYGQPGKCDHPTQKPLGIIRKHIAAMVPPDGLCIDPFMGSGTTLRAAKDLGRRCIGIEIEEKYCQTAVERLRQGVLPFGEDDD